MVIRAGLRAEIEAEVTTADTALALGSGDVAVLGTPRALALAEAATVAAIAERLEPGLTSVGTHVSLAHTAPTPVGARVVAAAELRDVEGDRLTFTVTLRQEGRTVADGTVRRVVVDRTRFGARAASG